MKQDLDSILLANYYFIKCKVENPLCHKTELARKYLSAKIKLALSERKSKQDIQSSKAFFINNN
jgi:hypothetical protein